MRPPDAKNGTAPAKAVPASTSPAKALDASNLQPGRDAARELASRGWHVFPCWPGTKRPAVDCWEQKACADPERVARFWPGPRHNIGVACGPSGLVVVDLDTHDPLPEGWKLPGILDGRDVLAQLCEWARQPWPSTYMVATPLGGWHLYYLAPAGEEIRNSAGKLGPSVDVRGAGGLVLGAGSVVDERAYHDRPDLAAKVRGGKPYVVLGDQPPVPLPAWLCSMLAAKQAAPRPAGRQPRAPAGARLRGLAQTVRDGQPGDRTGPLVWAAHRLAEMIGEGEATIDDGELLVAAAVAAGINGGERYARGQVAHVLGAAR